MGKEDYGYYAEIDQLKTEYNVQLEKKADARTENKKYYVILCNLASELSPLRDTASIDNKIISLLSLKDEQMRADCKRYFESWQESDVIFKNARDRIEYLNTCIIEYQSRRKTERDLKQ